VKSFFTYAGIALLCIGLGLVVGRYFLPVHQPVEEHVTVVRPDSAHVDSLHFVIVDLTGKFDSVQVRQRFTESQRKRAESVIQSLAKRIAKLEVDSIMQPLIAFGDTTVGEIDTTYIKTRDSTYTFINRRELRASMMYDITLDLFGLDAIVSPTNTYFTVSDTTKIQSPPIFKSERSPFWYEAFPFVGGAFAVAGISNKSPTLEIIALALIITRVGLWIF
jgi:hypothetical protein